MMQFIALIVLLLVWAFLYVLYPKTRELLLRRMPLVIVLVITLITGLNLILSKHI